MGGPEVGLGGEGGGLGEGEKARKEGGRGVRGKREGGSEGG